VKELERRRSLSRTSRPQRDTARAFGPKPVQPKPNRNCAAAVTDAKPKSCSRLPLADVFVHVHTSTNLKMIKNEILRSIDIDYL